MTMYDEDGIYMQFQIVIHFILEGYVCPSMKGYEIRSPRYKSQHF